MKYLFIIICLALAGCDEQPDRRSQTEKFQLTFLFEKDGVKVYRFYDAGYYRYFCDARGAVAWDQHHGKAGNTPYTVETVVP